MFIESSVFSSILIKIFAVISCLFFILFKFSKAEIKGEPQYDDMHGGMVVRFLRYIRAISKTHFKNLFSKCRSIKSLGDLSERSMNVGSLNIKAISFGKASEAIYLANWFSQIKSILVLGLKFSTPVTSGGWLFCLRNESH